MVHRPRPRVALLVAAAWALGGGGPSTAPAVGAPPVPTAEVLRERLAPTEADAAIREALEKICLAEGKHWDDAKRECVYLMRSKD